MRRFIVEPDRIRDGKALLTGGEAHHAAHVLRLSPGDEVILLDGRGMEYKATIQSLGRKGVLLEILEKSEGLPESPLKLTLGISVLKSERMDLLVEKLTELGLQTLAPLVTARTAQQNIEKKSDSRITRWLRISRQALKQCRRAEPLDIRPIVGIRDFVSAADDSALKIMLHNPASKWKSPRWQGLLESPCPSKSVWALVGPEGGFTEEEVNIAVEFGFIPLNLGPRILRAETAALALTVIFGFELGDLA